MSAATNGVALPPGADPDMVDEWTGDSIREVCAQIGAVAVSPDPLKCPTVTVLAEQRRDGAVGCIDVLLDVEMGRSDARMSTTQARQLAALLLRAVDTAAAWTSLDCTTCAHWDSCPRHPKQVSR